MCVCVCVVVCFCCCFFFCFLFFFYSYFYSCFVSNNFNRIVEFCHLHLFNDTKSCSTRMQLCKLRYSHMKSFSEIEASIVVLLFVLLSKDILDRFALT